MSHPKPCSLSCLTLRWAAASVYALVSFSWIVSPHLTDLSEAILRLCWQFFWAHTLHFSHFSLNSVTSLRVYFCISLWVRVQWHTRSALIPGSRVSNSPALSALSVHLSVAGPREKDLVHCSLLQSSTEMVFFSQTWYIILRSFALLKWYTFFFICLPCSYR